MWREREREREMGSSVTLSDITLPNNFYIINILKISPLYYIFFLMFLIYMSNFMLTRCYLFFDLYTIFYA